MSDRQLQNSAQSWRGRPSRRIAVLAAVVALGLLFIVLTPLRSQAATRTNRAAVASTGGAGLAAPVVGSAATPDGQGYWLVARDGGVFSSGDAGFYGSAGGAHLAAPVVGMAATPDGHGYWLVAADGGIFSYGDAHFYGSTGGTRLNQPIVGMAPTPDGGGYWLVAADGGIFSYGDAHFYGSTGGTRLNQPIVGMAPTPDGGGYWLVAADGGIFSYGDAHFYGSTGGTRLNAPIVAVTAGRTGGGYRLTASDGTTYSYGSVRAASSSCPSAVCVDVNTTDVLGPASRVGQGFLHSLYPIGQEPQRLAALNGSAWRSSVYGSAYAQANTSRWDIAESDNIPTTAIVSDMWYTDTGSGATAPWSNWGNYRNWVESQVLQILAAGYKVGYWEVYNEPDLLSGYYQPSVYATVTPALLLQQFLVTYQAIRAVDPSAQVIGPSLANFYATPTQKTFSLQQFLAYAAANHIQLAALSWHANTDRPQEIPAEAAQARSMIAAYPALGDPKLVINEYGTQGVQRIPGWDLAYLAALNTAGVSQANRSCWAGDCTRPVLDGLLAPDGTGTLPDYWLRLAYGQVSGDRVRSASSQADVSTLAYYDSSSGRATVMVGRGVGCAQDPRCSAAVPDAPPTTIRVRVQVPWGSGQVSITRTVIPGTSISVMGQPPSTASQELITPSPGGGGTVTLFLNSFNDGDAAVIGISHAG